MASKGRRLPNLTLLTSTIEGAVVETESSQVDDGAPRIATLRDAGRGIAPDHVLDRRLKVGFNASVLSFLDPSEPAVYEELTRDGPLFDVMRRDRVLEMLDKRALPNSESKFLFNLVNTKVFLESFAA